MIGFIEGTALFSDGNEVLVQTAQGVGYQVFYNRVVIEGSWVSLYISHVIREDHQSLYGFSSFQDKKLFEMLTTVKGIGPKSAYSMVTSLGCEQICTAVMTENKKLLSTAPGVGPKSAAQVVLDLSGKLHKIKMFSKSYNVDSATSSHNIVVSDDSRIGRAKAEPRRDHMTIGIVDDAIMACKELGFREEKVIPLIQKIMTDNELTSSEQLVHLVLREV